MTTTATTSTTLRALRGWPLFIAFSLLVHLALLLLWYLLPPEPITVSDAPVAPIAVQLQRAAPPAPPAPAAATRSEPSVATPAATPTAPAPPMSAPAPAPAIIEALPPTQPSTTVMPEFDERELGTSRRLFETFPGVGSPVPATPGPAQEEKKPDEETLLHIESLIRTRFAKHFHYPPMAQRQGWKGEVLLAFRIGPDGQISHIQIAQSSGHAILDQAALDSMHHIERIEFTPGMVLHQMIEVRMPVIYHLAQG